MKPKPIFRYVILTLVAITTAFFLESTREADNLSERSIKGIPGPDYVEASNNDFIFFESVSKYLLLSLKK